ncbi:MAG: hypothetical protein ACD_19C00400G0002, partial [uncultured bacterium]
MTSHKRIYDQIVKWSFSNIKIAFHMIYYKSKGFKMLIKIVYYMGCTSLDFRTTNLINEDFMISVIIVNYKTFDMTSLTIRRVLDSICSDPIEIVLVDNDSGDGSYEELKRRFAYVGNIIWLKNDMNRGFASANNLGIQHSKGDYVLILNSDVEVEKNTLEVMVDFLKSDPNIGAVGPKIVLNTGELDHTCKRGFPTPLSTL